MNAVKPDRRTAKRAAGMLLCLLALFAAVPQAGAVNPGARYFTHLKTTDSGLSYNCVHAIIQDSRGFIWLGTSDGLNRYDGMRFRTFHKNELGGNSGFIVSLCEDDRGDIWIGTDSGVVLYDAATDRFRALDTPSDRGTVIHNKVTTIKKDRQGVIWMAVNNQGLFSCDPESGALKNYFVEEGRQTLPANITSFCFDVNNECWLSLYFSNLYHADKALTEATPVEFGDRGQLFRNDNIIEIIESPYNTLYVASVDKGVCEIAPRSSKIRTLIPNAENRYVPESLFSGRDGELWAATTKGIYVYNPGSGETIRLKADRQDKFSLSDSHTLSVLVDDSDGIWIGTNAGGVNYSGAFHQNFDKYHIVGDEPLANCLVRGFADDGEGRLWITTEKSGLMTYSLKTKELRKYRNKQLPEALFGIGHDDGKLWLGSFQGLYRLDLKTGAVKVYSRRDESSSLHDNKIYTIYKTSEGDLLVGTTLGMLRYDRAGDSFTPIPVFEGMFITDIAEDISGDLWVATYANGLIRYDPAAGAIVRSYTYAADNPRSLPSNKVLSVFRDSADRIWATTFSAGFCLYDGQNDDFVVYDQALLGAGNLPSDINYRIVEDDSGNLWISTNKGLICFTPATLETKAYTTTDGLLNDEFNYNAGFKTSDGTLYFGSSDGFVRFNPRTFHTDTRVPEIVITDLRIGERIVKAGEEGSPLACNIDRTQHIALNARQNSFGFGFALLGFASPASNTILCRLEGYDTHWRKVPESNRIFYSNIPAGSYRLQVKGVNSNGIWNDRHPAVEITVAQRFYKSTPAILLYVLLLIVASILVSHYFYRKAVKRERQRQNEYKRAREIELFNEKMAFFSNIVHEIKTPLTLIRTPLQNILASGECGGEVREDLMVINNNTEYLSQLVKELLDFVKIECHGYMLNCGNLDLIEKIGFLCFNFAETAKSNNLRLTFRHEEEQLSILADEPGLNKILNNLLHNALKYAESYIEVEARSEGGNAVVSIRNDGPIIPKEHRSRIFEPFVQYGNDAKGVGIGLSLARTLAELHGGSLVLDDGTECTDFILTLPLRRTAAEPADGEEATAAPEGGPEKPGLPTLLIVEDNADLSAYLKRKLQGEYRILTAVSAERALELLRQQEADLVLSDIALNGMSGLELCKRICGDFETSHIPVILLSALSSTRSKVVGMECGASLYIEKPFSMEYLQACIRNILDKRSAMKNAFKNKAMPLAAHLYNLPHSDEEFLSRLDAIILANISDPNFSNEQLAEAFCLSKSTLNRKIKGLLDTTPNDYIRTKRLVVAAQMLTENHCRINEVCYSVGFNTPSYFAKCFKKFYGILPAEYMKEHNAD